MVDRVLASRPPRRLPPVRSRVCHDAAWLGVEIDEAANDAGRQRIDTGAGRVGVWVVPTNEELMIARHSRRLLRGVKGAET